MDRTLKPGGAAFNVVLAHELQHLIQAHNAPREEAWVNEGLSEDSSMLVGGAASSIKTFAANPQTQLNLWDSESTGAALRRGRGVPALRRQPLRRRSLARRDRPGAAGRRGGRRRIPGIARPAAPLPRRLRRLDCGEHPQPRRRPVREPGPRHRYPHRQRASGRRRRRWQRAPVRHRLLRHARPRRRRVRAQVPRRSAGADSAAGRAGRGAGVVGQRAGSDRYDPDATMSTSPARRAPALAFKTWFDIERWYDWGYVSVSTDGGATWQALAGSQTNGEDPAKQAIGPGYSGSSGAGDEPPGSMNRSR